MSELKKVSKRWWAAVFCLPIIWILWLILSIVFWTISLAQTWWDTSLIQVGWSDSFLSVVRWLINRILGICALLWIPLTVVWIIKVAMWGNGLTWRSITYGWKQAKKTIRNWIGILSVWLVWVIWLSVWSQQYLTVDEELVEQDIQQMFANDNWIVEETEVVETYRTFARMRGENQVIREWKQTPYYISQVVSTILSVLFFLCLTSWAIRLVYGSWLTFSRFFEKLKGWIIAKYLWAWILMYLMLFIWFIPTAGIGYLLSTGSWGEGYLILFSIFGLMAWVRLIYASIRLKFFDVPVLLWTHGPIQALKHSWKITKNKRWTIFGFQIMQWFIQIPWALVFGIGLFWTMPTAYIADVKAYKILNGEDDEEEEVESVIVNGVVL